MHHTPTPKVFNDMDYKKEIKINPDNLEHEWLIQPSNYLDACELYSDAIEIRDKAKLKLDVVYAELDAKVRKNYSKYFDSKPTETQIKQWILLRKEYQKAEYALIRANKSANNMLGVKQSFEHKKAALGNIVQMKLSGYYSEPSINLSEVVILSFDFWWFTIKIFRIPEIS